MGLGRSYACDRFQKVLGLGRAWVYKLAQLDPISTNEPCLGLLCFTGPAHLTTYAQQKSDFGCFI